MTKLEVCPCCGQTIAPPLIFPTRPVSQRLYDFVAKRPAGVTTNQIADAIYGDDPNGGPDSPNAVKALIWRLNVILKVKHHMAIRGSMGRGSIYRLVQL
jgi:hypothetical protein